MSLVRTEVRDGVALVTLDDPGRRNALSLPMADELTEAGCDWQIHAYGGTKHAFTNPAANDHKLGTVYSQTAERRALESMRTFLAEALA